MTASFELLERMKMLKCYYDEKKNFSFSLDSNLTFAKMYHANYYASISNISLNFLATISRLNCPPLQDYVPVELHRESWIERENYVIYL